MRALSRKLLVPQLQALPAAAPLLERLGEVPGVYLVGGSVRDLLLGGEPLDLDLVVEGDIEEVRARLDGEVRVHDRFGTFTAHVDGFTYDVARARRERYLRPGALPEVEPAPLAADLERRDFTVNAIAAGLSANALGEVHAAPRAVEDLESGVLRVLHDRSFEDDPTRLLRLARYKARLGFVIDPHTSGLARQAVEAGGLETVSGARIGAELRLLAAEADPVTAFAILHELGIDHAIHPGLELADPALLEQGLELLPLAARHDRLILAAAALRIPGPELAGLLDRLAFAAQDRAAIVAAANGAEPLAACLKRATRPSQIAACARNATPELVALAGALGPSEAASAWLHGLESIRLEIDGADLLAAGVEEGPAIGRALRAALEAKLDGSATGRDAELEVALEAVRGSS